MDRHTNQGYDHTSGTGKPISQTIKEYIPGTNEYQATHGVDAAHHNVEQLKTHVPGTEEHRMREAGVVHGTGMGTGAGMGTHHTTGMGTHHTSGMGQPTMGERVQQSIPGTNEYEATHGMTGAHRTVEQAKAHIPGTEEHRIYEATHPGNVGTGMGTHTGTTGMGTHTGMGHSDMRHTGMGHTGMGHTGTTGTTGLGTHTGTTGMGTMGHHEGEKKGMGEKIKEALPGTREHEAKKMAEGRF